MGREAENGVPSEPQEERADEPQGSKRVGSVWIISDPIADGEGLGSNHR